MDSSAATDVLVYEITYDNMMTVINYDPEILETISQVIAERLVQAESLLNTMNKREKIEETKNITNELFIRVKSFFGLVKDTVTPPRGTP